MKCPAHLFPLALVPLLLFGCLDANPIEPPASTAEKFQEDLAAFSGHSAAAHAGDYPIRIHWMQEPEWDGLKWAVEAAARRWSHIIAPTPTASYTFLRPVSCWVAETSDGATATVNFEVGDTLAPGVHIYVATGTSHSTSWGGSWAWANECVPRDYAEWIYGQRVPFNTDYNPVTNTVPAGIVGIATGLDAAYTPAIDEWWIESDLHKARFAYGIAMHEIGHVLGIGTSETWYNGLYYAQGTKSIREIDIWYQPTDSVGTGGDTIYVEVADTIWGSWWCSTASPESRDEICGDGRAKVMRHAFFWDPPDNSFPAEAFREFLSHQEWAGYKGTYEGRLFQADDMFSFYSFAGDTTLASFHFPSNCFGSPQITVPTRGRWRDGGGLSSDVMLSGFSYGTWTRTQPIVTLLTANALHGFKVNPFELDWQKYQNMHGCMRMMTPADSLLEYYPTKEFWAGDALKTGRLQADPFIGPDKAVHEPIRGIESPFRRSRSTK